MLGAIMGEDHNVPYKEENILQKLKIGLEVLKKPSQINFKTNQLQTKYPLSFDVKDVKRKRGVINISSDFSKPIRSPQNLVLLKDVKYRIYTIFDIGAERKTTQQEIEDSHIHEEKFNELVRRIKNHEYHYHPYLGRANFLASIKYIDMVCVVKINPSESSKVHQFIETSTLCPSTAIKDIKAENFSLITNIPNDYKIIEKSIKGTQSLFVKLKKIVNMVYFTGSIKVSPTIPFYRISSSNHSELLGKNIIVFP